MGICCITQGTQTGALWLPKDVDGVGGGKETRERGDIYIYVPMTDPYWYMAETTQYCNYPSI